MSTPGNPSKRILVVGGGVIGATAALLLGQCGFQVTLLDASGAPDWSVDQPVGLRVAAISPGSAQILDAAGVWSAVTSARSCAYGRMQVQDGADGAALSFEAPLFGHERLGTIVENHLLGHCLWQALAREPAVEIRAPARVTACTQTPEHISISLEDGEQLTADLMLACDGGASPLRRLLGIRGRVWDYNQRGLVGCVRHTRPNSGTAWQRFLPTGPLAFLPLADGRSSMVWTLPSQDAQALLAGSDEHLSERLNAVAGDFLGPVGELGPRAAFPLTMRLGEHSVVGRAVLLGDAAHVVHPLAGQGVNMGFADVAALVETLLEQRRQGQGLSQPAALRRFAQARRSEVSLMAAGVHGLGLAFRADTISPLRSLGMRLVQSSWTLRDAFLQRAAGQGPNAPALARGISLGELMAAR